MPFQPLAKIARALRVMRRAYVRAMQDAYDEEELHRHFPHVIFGRDVKIKRMERFYPGKRVFIHDFVYLHCAGSQWSGGSGFIRMGDNCEVGPYCAIWGAGGVTIGANVHIGDHSTITSHTAKHIKPDQTDIWKPLEMDFAEIVIGDHVILGAHVVITPGVRIGDHVMIGANSVVTKDVPANCLYAGVPAHFIRELRPGEVAQARDTFNPLVTP
jgi:acetyltransferase-like isoleucine patch superfamily enzyme